MAKKDSRREFDFETIPSTEATKRKSQRGRRRSKYSPIGEKFEALSQDETLVFTATKNEVQGIRNYMRRNFDGEHAVSSRAAAGDNFEVFISKE
ncbi:MAG: hypothetical protein AAF791_00860 [Bacteroidota bacterium]